MSKHYPKIQLKRSKLGYSDTTITNTELDYGEPLFLSTNNYLTIGGAGTDKKVSAQRLIKTYEKDLVDDSLFYRGDSVWGDYSGTKKVFLINDQKEKLYLLAKDVLKDDGTSVEEDIANIWSFAKIMNGGNSTSTKAAEEKAPIAGPTFRKNGTKWPESVTPDWTSNDTTIATTSFVRNIISHISELKFVSGTGWKIKKTPTTENKNFYVCGVSAQDEPFYYCTSGSQSNNGVYFNGSTGVLHGACWNDFAEYRECNNAPAGTVVCEVGDGTLSVSSERLQAGASIISDTYGMVIGNETETASPIAVAGRVLAKYSGNIEDYKAGSPVCASEDGKIAVMTREEIKEYPDRILGYVSEIPSYDTWNNVSVDNRIWIKIK